MGVRSKVDAGSLATFGNADYPKSGIDFTSDGQPFLQNPNGVNLGRFVKATATITSAAAGTAVSIIPDSYVGAGEKVYLITYVARVNGTTGWGTTATVKLQDTNGTPVDMVTWAVAGMTNQARLVPGTANTTLEDAYSLGTGGTAGKGLQLKGNANGTGSDFVVTVLAYIA